MFLSTAVGAVVFFAIFFLFFDTWGNHALWVALLTYLILRGVVLHMLYLRKVSVSE